MVYESFERLAELGVWDVFLPFLLVFAIVYAVLHKTKVLGEKSKNFNTVISLVMGLSVVFPHVLWGTRCSYMDGGACPKLANGMVDPVHVINTALPNVSLIMIAVLMVLLIFGIWGSKVKLGNNSLSGLIAIVAFGSVVYIFGSAAGWWSPFNVLMWNGQFLGGEETVALIVTVLVFAIIIWFITKEDDKDEEKKNAFGEFFGSILDKDRE
jgi:hypothetical protein